MGFEMLEAGHLVGWGFAAVVWLLSLALAVVCLARAPGARTALGLAAPLFGGPLAVGVAYWGIRSELALFAGERMALPLLGAIGWGALVVALVLAAQQATALARVSGSAHGDPRRAAE